MVGKRKRDNREGLPDRRVRLPGAGPEARGPGAIEGNVDKCPANRFKKRGKRFTAAGAHYPAKVVELRLNGRLAEFVPEGTREREAEERRRGVTEAPSPLRRKISVDPGGMAQGPYAGPLRTLFRPTPGQDPQGHEPACGGGVMVYIGISAC